MSKGNKEKNYLLEKIGLIVNLSICPAIIIFFTLIFSDQEIDLYKILRMSILILALIVFTICITVILCKSMKQKNEEIEKERIAKIYEGSLDLITTNCCGNKRLCPKTIKDDKDVKNDKKED